MPATDAPHLIIGCGYTGLVTARRLVALGERVIGTSRTDERKPEVTAAGASFASFNLDADEPVPHKHPKSVILLAPPPAEDADGTVERLRRVAEQVNGAPIVVVISTAIFGDTRGTITERTHPAPRTDRERRWALMDAAALYLREEEKHDVRVVRTPAIYGPGRDFRAKLLTGDSTVVRPAPPTSRIHVDDLASLLIRMGQPGGPPMLLACDDLPSPTWRVTVEAARLLSLPPPKELTPEQAAGQLSDIGLEMRLSGHSCMSLVRPYLGVRLKYPTYREGLRACLLGERKS